MDLFHKRPGKTSCPGKSGCSGPQCRILSFRQLSRPGSYDSLLPCRQCKAGLEQGAGLANRRQPLCSRSEEHTSELQSLMRISYAVFCLKKKTTHKNKELKHYCLQHN